MPPKRILVTGAAGFVAAHLTRRILAEWPDCELILADRNAGIRRGIAIRPVDVANEQEVIRLIKGSQPDVVVHLAAVSAISNAVADRRRTWEINALSPYYLSMAIMDYVPDCHLVFVSSAEVYGRSAAPGIKLTETTLLQPANPYASAKAAADLLIQETASDRLSAAIMRPFNHTGPEQSLAFAIPSFCSQIVAIERGAEPVIRVGALDDVRDFLHVADVVEAYVKMIKDRERYRSGEAFNVCSGIPVRMQDVLDCLLSLTSIQVCVEVDQNRLRGRNATSVVGDSAKIQAAVGWEPTLDLRHTLAETLDYWRNQPV